LIQGLRLKDIPNRDDPRNWPALRDLFTKTFKSKTRKEWEDEFDDSDACCTPVLDQRELENSGFDQRPIVTLRDSPGLALADGADEESDVAVRSAKGQGIGVKGQGWEEKGLSVGVGGEELLAQWVGWKRGRQYDVANGGLVKKEDSKL